MTECLLTPVDLAMLFVRDHVRFRCVPAEYISYRSHICDPIYPCTHGSQSRIQHIHDPLRPFFMTPFSQSAMFSSYLCKSVNFRADCLQCNTELITHTPEFDTPKRYPLSTVYFPLLSVHARHTSIEERYVSCAHLVP